MVATLTTLHLLDVVALTEALPDYDLLPGQVGTIVETLATDVYEVEFSDNDGQTYAMLPLKTQQLIRLHYSPFTSLTSSNQLPPTVSTQPNQSGKNNIASDKVLGDKAQSPTNNNPDLAQAACDIKAILNELSEEYNPVTEKGQARIKSEALVQVKQNPQLKQHTISALKSVGEEALAQAIQHPVAKVVVEAAKVFLEG